MSWRWLVGADVTPAPDARAVLEAVAAEHGDAKVISSWLTGPGPDPWPELFRREAAIGACRDRLLAVRAVPAGSLLVREDVLAVHGEPPARPWGADLAWSATALRDGGGYLAPRSLAHRAPARAPGRLERVRGRARLAALPGLTATERLWLAHLAAQAALRR